MVTNSNKRVSSFTFLCSALAAIILVGCHNTPDNKNNPVTPPPSSGNAMSMYISSVKLLHLPFKDTCFDTMATQHAVTLPDSLEKFKKYGQVVGKINETPRYTAIIYSISADVQLPILNTFNARGERISSLKLFIGDCCGENEDCSGLSTVTITKNMHIILKDSMQKFDRDKKKFDKKRNIQILKKVEEYRIDSTGKIIRLGSHITKEISVTFILAATADQSGS
ncbi:MAG TPA: hypothetical protein VK809_08670 [Bacteroidia bacterium]|jgi:hypothetical protein|nr:hypothetical protein [Bacteroidia bacterium]